MAHAQPTRTWDSAEAAAAWRQGAARRAQIVAAATERMLDAVGLQAGMRVLDLAAGTGDQSLLAAQRVGTTGSVLATDISASMLAVAVESARQAGLDNISTLAADAATLEVADDQFDAAICRFGLMFMPDLHAVLTRVHRALKPGGKFGALVWSTEDKNPWISTPLNVVREMGRFPSPPPSLARTVSLSAPGALEGAFSNAGFRDVQLSTVATPRVFATAAEAAETARQTSPAHSELLKELNDAERQLFYAEVERGLQRFMQPDGRCVVPGEAILAVATR